MIYLNINGLYHSGGNCKVDFIKDLVNRQNCEVENIAILLTETHLHSDIKDSEIQIEGYNLYRKDRSNRSHGGVSVYVREGITSEERCSFSNGVCEFLGLKLNINANECGLYVLYRPPDCKNREFGEISDFVVDFFSSDRILIDQDALLFGDFNLPKSITWVKDDGLDFLMPTYIGFQATKLKEIVDRLYMTQLITEPTKGSNILDLMYCNNVSLVDKIDILPCNLSDHNLIYVEIHFKYKMNIQYENSLPGILSNVNIYSANFKLINDKLFEIEWKKNSTKEM